MKRFIFALGFFSVSTMSLALDCGYLGITITNTTPYDCKLIATRTYYGAHRGGTAPINIPSGATSESFYMQQDTNGIDVVLYYRCDNKPAIFRSEQNYCGLIAGNIWGNALYSENELGLEHRETIGSYWSSKPGEIAWKIY